MDTIAALLADLGENSIDEAHPHTNTYKHTHTLSLSLSLSLSLMEMISKAH